MVACEATFAFVLDLFMFGNAVETYDKSTNVDLLEGSGREVTAPRPPLIVRSQCSRLNPLQNLTEVPASVLPAFADFSLPHRTLPIVPVLSGARIGE